MLRTFALISMVCIASLASCAPPPSSRQVTEPGAAGPGQAAPAPSAAPKRMTIGITGEPKGWGPFHTSTTIGGLNEIIALATRSLTLIDGQNSVQPELAVSVPSLERGDWLINADGTMDQTWKLRPGLKWHDGQPLTADDFVFAWEVSSNPELPRTVLPGFNLITSATAPDAQTLQLNFRSTTPLAGKAMFDPIPRHIVGTLAASGDVERFINDEFWNTSYVGAGPYRVTRWERGAHIDYAAFPDYVGGKPKIDMLQVRFLGDANTLLANILAGEVDTAWPDGIGVEAALQLKQTWAAPGTGNNLLLFVDGRMSWMEFQYRAEFADPPAARDPRVRRAFYHTIDKPAITELETAGLGIVADSPIRPDDPRRPQFASAIPDWSLDLTLAQRILADAGWQRGSDGTLVHGPTGQRMETEIRVTNTTAHVNALAVMAESWRKVGAQVTETVIPGALVADGRYRSTYGFVGLSAGGNFSGLDGGVLGGTETNFSCALVARAETNWAPASNRQGYCNAASDPLINRLQTTIPIAERTAIQVDLVRLIYKEDYGQLPLFWLVVPLPYAKGITGPAPVRTSWTTWNIHLWDKS